MLNEDLSLLKKQHELKSDFSKAKLSGASETNASGSSMMRNNWVDELRIDDETNDDDEKVTRRRCISNNVVI